jgi:ribosomal protein L44E
MELFLSEQRRIRRKGEGTTNISKIKIKKNSKLNIDFNLWVINLHFTKCLTNVTDFSIAKI